VKPGLCPARINTTAGSRPDTVAVPSNNRGSQDSTSLVDWAQTVPIEIHQPRVTPRTARRVLEWLAQFADPATGSVSTYRVTVAEDLGLRTDTVKRTLRELDRAGLLTRVPVIWSNGWSAVSAYYLHHPGCPTPPESITLDRPLRPHQPRERRFPGWQHGIGDDTSANPP